MEQVLSIGLRKMEGCSQEGVQLYGKEEVWEIIKIEGIPEGRRTIKNNG
jgi:hypothetical protein